MTWPISREGKFHRLIWHHVEDLQDKIAEKIETTICGNQLKLVTRKKLRTLKIRVRAAVILFKRAICGFSMRR